MQDNKLNNNNPNISEKQKQENAFFPCLQGFRMHLQEKKRKQMNDQLKSMNSLLSIY